MTAFTNILFIQSFKVSPSIRYMYDVSIGLRKSTHNCNTIVRTIQTRWSLANVVSDVSHGLRVYLFYRFSCILSQHWRYNVYLTVMILGRQRSWRINIILVLNGRPMINM